jgi:hypothetical protein
MTFFLAVVAWLVMAGILVVGIVLATHGTLWLFIVSLVLFILAFAKWGCAVH